MTSEIIFLYTQIMKTKIKNKIRLAREKAKLSQEELARKLGVSIFTINRWESPNNDYEPRQIWVDKIIEVCNGKNN